MSYNESVIGKFINELKSDIKIYCADRSISRNSKSALELYEKTILGIETEIVSKFDTGNVPGITALREIKAKLSEILKDKTIADSVQYVPVKLLIKVATFLEKHPQYVELIKGFVSQEAIDAVKEAQTDPRAAVVNAVVGTVGSIASIFKQSPPLPPKNMKLVAETSIQASYIKYRNEAIALITPHIKKDFDIKKNLLLKKLITILNKTETLEESSFNSLRAIVLDIQLEQMDYPRIFALILGTPDEEDKKAIIELTKYPMFTIDELDRKQIIASVTALFRKLGIDLEEKTEENQEKQKESYETFEAIPSVSVTSQDRTKSNVEENPLSDSFLIEMEKILSVSAETKEEQLMTEFGCNNIKSADPNTKYDDKNVRTEAISALQKDLDDFTMTDSLQLDIANKIETLTEIDNQLSSSENATMTAEPSLQKEQTLVSESVSRTLSEEEVEEMKLLFNFQDTLPQTEDEEVKEYRSAEERTDALARLLGTDISDIAHAQEDSLYQRLDAIHNELTFLEKIKGKNYPDKLATILDDINRLDIHEFIQILEDLLPIPKVQTVGQVITIATSINNFGDNILAEVGNTRRSITELVTFYEKICSLDDLLKEKGLSFEGIEKIGQARTGLEDKLVVKTEEVKKELENYCNEHDQTLFQASYARQVLKEQSLDRIELDNAKYLSDEQKENIKELIDTLKGIDVCPIAIISEHINNLAKNEEEQTKESLEATLNVLKEKDQELETHQTAITNSKLDTTSKFEIKGRITSTQEAIKNLRFKISLSLLEKKADEFILDENASLKEVQVMSKKLEDEIISGLKLLKEENEINNVAFEPQFNNIEKKIESIKNSGINALNSFFTVLDDMRKKGSLAGGHTQQSILNKLEQVPQKNNKALDELIAEIKKTLPLSIYTANLCRAEQGLDECTNGYSKVYIAELKTNFLEKLTLNSTLDSEIENTQQKLKKGIALFKHDLKLASTLRRIYIAVSQKDFYEGESTTQRCRNEVQKLLDEQNLLLPDSITLNSINLENSSQDKDLSPERQKSQAETALRDKIQTLRTLNLPDDEKKVCEELASSLDLKLNEIVESKQNYSEEEVTKMQENFEILLFSQEDKMANHRDPRLSKRVLHNIVAALATFFLSLIGVGIYKACTAQPFSLFFDVKTNRRELLDSVKVDFDKYMAAPSV